MKTHLAMVLAGAFAALTLSAPVAAQDAEAKATQRMKGMDTDGDGSVSLAEFTEFRRGWTSKRPDGEMQMKPEVVQRAFGKIDRDGDGMLTHAEMLADTKASMKRK